MKARPRIVAASLSLLILGLAAALMPRQPLKKRYFGPSLSMKRLELSQIQRSGATTSGTVLVGVTTSRSITPIRLPTSLPMGWGI